MYPNIPQAQMALEEAGRMNPGPWTEHSRYAAQAAKNIAGAAGLDGKKAYVCGLLHDIGRRSGISAMRHAIDGYDYAMAQGWDEVARICLSHSFPVQDIEKDIGRKDITREQYEFIDRYLKTVEYDDYDRLIILCDSLAEATGFCILEKRFVDTTRRYGVYPFTVERWNAVFAIRDDLEKRAGQSIYSLLPGVENCLYR